jgi:hypothetical protein
MRAIISLKDPVYVGEMPHYTIATESAEVNDAIVAINTGVGILTINNLSLVSLLEVDTQEAFDAIVADADAFTLVV